MEYPSKNNISKWVTGVGILSGFTTLLAAAYPEVIARSFARASLLLLLISSFTLISMFFAPYIRRWLKFGEEQDSDEKLYDYWAKRLGYGFESLKVECSIEAGGVVGVTREVTVTARDEVREIATILPIPEIPTEGNSSSVSPPHATSLTPDWNVSLIPTYDRDKPEISSALLTLAPELMAGKTMRCQLVHAYKTNWPPLSMAKAGKFAYDYFCWNIDQYATKQLSLRVYFPYGHAEPSYFGREVLSIGSDRPQTEEQKRLDVCKLTFEGGRYLLSLDIKYPMPGLLYVIKWRLPTPEQSPQDMSPGHIEQAVQNTGISPALSNRLRAALPRCGPFRSNEELKAVFTDERISAWRNRVPEAEATASRVDALIFRLYDQRDAEGRNALSLFLQVAADRLDPADGCKSELESLVKELRNL